MAPLAAEDVVHHGHGIHAIDTGFIRPRFDASHLIVEGGRAAFVDVGTNHSIPRLLAALERLGLARDAVDYVILTHVHLDHAGGAGLLMQSLPQAKLVVHPRGARHMIDPSKLIAGATAVYGEEEMQRSYGTLVPVPAERVIEAPDEFGLSLGGRPLRFLDTPGHARHHFCVWDEASRSFFTGDTFGLAYPELAGARGPFLIPTTTPVQFEPEALHASIDRLMAFRPEAMFLTHYSRVTGLEPLAGSLHEQIDAQVALGRGAAARADRGAYLRAAIADQFRARAADLECPLGGAAFDALLALDVELNAQGLEIWLDKQA
jgi:glyoxylase-like metal-dependent hydrolase (beta-lactamase superfamily II)